MTDGTTTTMAAAALTTTVRGKDRVREDRGSRKDATATAETENGEDLDRRRREEAQNGGIVDPGPACAIVALEPRPGTTPRTGRDGST
jgi:hypothetical protein